MVIYKYIYLIINIDEISFQNKNRIFYKFIFKAYLFNKI